MADGCEATPEAVAALARALGHEPRDRVLLKRGMTHVSHLGPQASAQRRLEEANERLEFLGDALLGAALAQLLYERHPGSDEGDLSIRRSKLGSRATLARAIEAAGLLPHCLVGTQNRTDPALWPESVKANLAEGILAVVWLEAGWDGLRRAVERLLAGHVEDPGSSIGDPRTRLQEWSHRHYKRLPEYSCERTGGTDHAPEFLARVTIAEHSATGRGTSRRRAEFAAAEALLSAVEQQDGA
jgi:ribonuclease-3